MDLRIAPCSGADLERLLEQDLPPHVAASHRERYAQQVAGQAIYLLAWRGDRYAGRGTLYPGSRYESVRQAHPETAEINALDVNPQGRGTGTALITAAEARAARAGHPSIGLAVELTNPAARRLYERLGYAPWGDGQVIDEWIERRESGVEIQHRDPCDYLIKHLKPTCQN